MGKESKDEDVLLETYQYSWTSNSDIPLHDFLTKYKPSMVQNDGTKPWIWVKGSASSQEDLDVAPAIKEAAALLKEVTEKVESIKNDDTIPTRSNKKSKSKKDIREQVQAEATEKLKEISVRHGYVSGKCSEYFYTLIFASTDNVDKVWSNLATSVVSGPLSSTCAYLAKVATCPEEESPNYQHLLCLYMPNIYDKDAVTEVMRILLRNHGLNLMGVKSNLYTSLGIASKHASGIQSTVWRNTALLKDAEIRELKDAFFADLKDKPAAGKASDKQDTENLPAASSKPKLKPKKKAEDDPFASDHDDGDAEEEKRRAELKTKKAAAKGKRVNESEDEGEEEDKRPKKKRIGKK